MAVIRVGGIRSDKVSENCRLAAGDTDEVNSLIHIKEVFYGNITVKTIFVI